MVNVPKTKKTYCKSKDYKKHTLHKVTQYKKGIKNTNFVVVTWSNWDCQVVMESKCRFKKIRKPPYFNQWINLKFLFCEVFDGVRCSLKEAVEMAGLAWQGLAHRGLDDAKEKIQLAYLPSGCTRVLNLLS